MTNYKEKFLPDDKEVEVAGGTLFAPYRYQFVSFGALLRHCYSSIPYEPTKEG
jgi:hypothetical protein